MRIVTEDRWTSALTVLVIVAGLSKPFWLPLSGFPVVVIGAGLLFFAGSLTLFGYWRVRRARFPQPCLSARDAPWIIACLFVVLLLSAAYRQWVLHASPMPPYWEDAGLDPLGWFGALILSPVGEEFMFRAWLLRRTPSSLAAWKTVLWVSLVFSFMHLWMQEMDWLSLALDLQRIPFYLIFSLGVSIVWLRTRSLAVCIAVHAGFNGLIGFLL